MKQSSESSSFWIAYANLILGLFFIFVMVIGLVVAKYYMSQNDLNIIKDKLAKEEEAVVYLNTNLAQKEQIINEFTTRINSLKTADWIAFKNAFEYYKKNMNFSIDKINENVGIITSKDSAFANTIGKKDEQILSLTQMAAQKDFEKNEATKDTQAIKSNLNELKNAQNTLNLKLKDKFDKIIDQRDVKFIYKNQIFPNNAHNINDAARFDLRRVLIDYFDLLLGFENLEQIYIFVYSDTNQNDLKSIELANKRVLEISKFINSFYADTRITKYLSIVPKSVNNNPNLIQMELGFDIGYKKIFNDISTILEQKQ